MMDLSYPDPPLRWEPCFDQVPNSVDLKEPEEVVLRFQDQTFFREPVEVVRKSGVLKRQLDALLDQYAIYPEENRLLELQVFSTGIDFLPFIDLLRLLHEFGSSGWEGPLKEKWQDSSIDKFLQLMQLAAVFDAGAPNDTEVRYGLSRVLSELQQAQMHVRALSRSSDLASQHQLASWRSNSAIMERRRSQSQHKGTARCRSFLQPDSGSSSGSGGDGDDAACVRVQSLPAVAAGALDVPEVRLGLSGSVAQRARLVNDMACILRRTQAHAGERPAADPLAQPIVRSLTAPAPFYLTRPVPAASAPRLLRQQSAYRARSWEQLMEYLEQNELAPDAPGSPPAQPSVSANTSLGSSLSKLRTLVRARLRLSSSSRSS